MGVLMIASFRAGMVPAIICVGSLFPVPGTLNGTQLLLLL